VRGLRILLPPLFPALLPVLFGLLPVAAQAQAYQCRIPQGRVSLPPVTRDGPVRDTAITGYTLALSWNPEFCRGREDDPRHARQCSGSGGRFGFVVHGLWAEGRGGNWPQWCENPRLPSAGAVRETLCTMPSERLIANEWAKHGTCVARSGDGYLRAARALYNSLRFPDYDRLSRQAGLTAGDIRRALADANPHWEARHIGLVVNQRGWLTEMRLCYGRDFMPVACDRRRYGPADDARVRIWRGL